MAEHTVIVPGKPERKQRPRVVGGRSGRVHTYTPKQTTDYEAQVGKAWRDSGGPHFEGPIAVRVEFSPDQAVITIAESELPKSKLRADIDNLGKAVLDGLQDDKKIDWVVAFPQ